jgi:hypothetical protein
VAQDQRIVVRVAPWLRGFLVMGTLGSVAFGGLLVVLVEGPAQWLAAVIAAVFAGSAIRYQYLRFEATADQIRVVNPFRSYRVPIGDAVGLGERSEVLTLGLLVRGHFHVEGAHLVLAGGGRLRVVVLDVEESGGLAFGSLDGGPVPALPALWNMVLALR